jgi:hypothetical protein
MGFLLRAGVRAARCSSLQQSNGCAGSGGSGCLRALGLVFLYLLILAPAGAPALAQAVPPAQQENHAPTGKRVATFLAGGALGLGIHEAGHVAMNLALGERPRLRKVDFHGIPFFAITHRSGLSPRREFLISSAGFWVQHAENEWLLGRRPNLRHERAPLAKGVFAFNVLASAAYSGAAFAKTGPVERDTRGMASASRIDERWIGALVLAPAVLDAWRYFHPDSKWAAWTSRGVKIGLVVLVAR